MLHCSMLSVECVILLFPSLWTVLGGLTCPVFAGPDPEASELRKRLVAKFPRVPDFVLYQNVVHLDAEARASRPAVAPIQSGLPPESPPERTATGGRTCVHQADPEQKDTKAGRRRPPASRETRRAAFV